MRLNGSLCLCQIVDVHECRLDAQRRQRMRHQVIASAIDGLLRHDMPMPLCQRLQYISNGSCAGCQGQRG